MGEFSGALGPLLIAIFLNTYVTGIAAFQHLSYRATKFNDSRIIKSMVMTLCLIDVFQACTGIYMVWIYCVTNYLNSRTLSDGASWPFTIIPIPNACSGITAHIFLAHRISKTTGRKVTSAVVVGFALTTFCLGIACGTSGIIQTGSLIDIAKTSHKPRRILATVWLIVQATTNLLTSSSLVFVFSHSRPPFMDYLSCNWSRFGRAAIQSGSLASLLSIAGLLAFVASPHNVLYMAFVLPLGRAYSICVMDSLIARDKRVALLLASLSNGGGPTPFSCGSDGVGVWAIGEMDTQASNFSHIQVKTERETFRDGVLHSQRNENETRNCHRDVIIESEREEIS